MLRNFCFTLNNPTLDECTALLECVNFTYVVWGAEIAPDTGTPHLQGYAELGKKTRFTTVAKFCGGRMHIEQRRGTQDQAIAYCKKDGAVVERGERRTQGARADLDVVRRMAIEDGMRGVTSVCNYQGMMVAQKFLTYNEEPRDWAPKVIWLWGETGVGKSRLARTLCGEDVYVKSTGGQYWDGYDGHTDIILDDFRDGWFDFDKVTTFNYMLGLCDRYAFVLNQKFGGRQCLARTIVITSPRKPEFTIRGGVEDMQQLLRRISEVREIVPDVPEVV